MTGLVSGNGAVLGASTVAGAAITVLPNTTGNGPYRYFLIATIIVASLVIITRFTKLVVTRLVK